MSSIDRSRTPRTTYLSSPFLTMVIALVVALLCFLNAELGGALVLRPQMLWPLWPGCAFLVAVLLLVPRRSWAILMAAGLTGFVLYDVRAGLALRSITLLILGDTVEVLIAIVGLSLAFDGLPRLNSIKSLAKYSFFAVILCPLAGTSIATAAFSGAYWIRWRIGFLTEALALLTLTPAILSWANIRQAAMRRSIVFYLEPAMLIAGLVLLGYIALVAQVNTSLPVLLYSLLPFLLWSALRFGVMGVSTSMLVVAFLSIWGAVHGKGPFAGAEPLKNVLSLQLFLSVAATTFMVLAAIVEQRKKAEDELSKSEEKFSKVFRQSPMALAITSTEDHRYIDVNETFERISGWRREEVVGRTPFDIGLWVDPVGRFDLTNQLQKDGSIRDLDIRFRMRDGTIRVFLGTAEAIELNGEQCMIAAVADITERRVAEEALRESQQRLSGIISSAMDAIISVDEQQRIVVFNAAAEKMFRCSAAEAIGQPLERFIPERFRSAHTKHIRQFGQTGVTTREMGALETLMAVRTNGEQFPIEASISQVESSGKKLFTAILRDITERQQAENALRQSEERFHKVFRSSPLAVTISTETDGRYLDVNEAFLQMLGYQRREVIGRTAQDLNFWAEPSDRVEMIRQLEETGRVTEFHTQYTTSKGKKRDAEVSVELVELDGRSCVLAITHDVTEVRTLEAQFRQAQKMDAVGRLAGGVAHDFNNLLGVIIGFTDLSLPLTTPESLLKRHLEQIQKASNRAVSLIRQLLAFSRQQVVFPTVLNLNEVVLNLTKMLQTMVGENVGFSFQPTEPIGSVYADMGQIEQILVNLVINARDAMPSGGTILISTANVELDEHYVSQHPGSRTGQRVVLSISDTGCGMDEVTMSKIFEPFFTTKEVSKGTGLGLSTVYGIVKQSGSYISVESEPGQGATFTIYFPRVSATAEPLVQSHEEAELSGGSETILVVEDDGALRDVTVCMLQDAGYKVLETGDAEVALGMVKAANASIDLLLTDVVMPGMNGVDLLEQARRIRPNLRSLFMSGYTGDPVHQRSQLARETAYLEKPFTRSSLLQRVRSALQAEPAKPQLERELNARAGDIH